MASLNNISPIVCMLYRGNIGTTSDIALGALQCLCLEMAKCLCSYNPFLIAVLSLRVFLYF